MWACLAQNVEVVKALTLKQYLLSKQVAPAKDESGATELHAAAYGGDVAICTALLAAGFPVSTRIFSLILCQCSAGQ